MDAVFFDLFARFQVRQRLAQLNQVSALLLPIAEELELVHNFVDGDCTEHVKPSGGNVAVVVRGRGDDAGARAGQNQRREAAATAPRGGGPGRSAAGRNRRPTTTPRLDCNGKRRCSSPGLGSNWAFPGRLGARAGGQLGESGQRRRTVATWRPLACPVSWDTRGGRNVRG